MAWHLNKGDWSEAYVFLKLLAEGRVYSGDEDLNKVLSVYMDIIKIIRKNLGVKHEYVINTDYIVAFEGREDRVLIPISEVSGYAERLFEYIRMAEGRKAFDFPDIEEYLVNTMGIHNIKEPCVDDEYDKKTDILLEVLNSNDSSREVIGFSVKSHLGNSPTLFNYSQASKMVYRIDGCDEETMHYLNSMKNSAGGCDLDTRINYIKMSEKLDLKFLGSKIIDNRKYGETRETGPFFTWNLEHYDVNMLSVFNAMLLSDYGYYARPATRKLSDVAEAVALINPLNVHSPNTVYKAKFKDFLFCAFAGLTASKRWDGTRRINGGYIDVKSNGEILYCRAVSDEKFTEYLFKNMKLERPEHGSYCKYTIAQAEEYLNGIEIPENISRKRNGDKRGDYGYVYYDAIHYEQPCYCIDINFTFRFRS
ncbi:MAG: HpaII family restriction endonuclease [Coprococcus sp.]